MKLVNKAIILILVICVSMSDIKTVRILGQNESIYIYN